MRPTRIASVRSGCSRAADPSSAARELREQIWQEGAALGVFFCSPRYDRSSLAACLAREFGQLELIGCTTAGEIGPDGFSSESITGFTLGADDFAAQTVLIRDLAAFGFTEGRDVVEQLKARLADCPLAADNSSCFGFLLVDGLSVQEEGVASALHASLGDIPLFGGSAGDELAFGKTWLHHDGRFRTGAAVFTLIRTALPFHVFKSQHFVASDRRLVVTEADASSRTVTEIDGGSAAQEYAQAIGLSVAQLDQQVFSTHPVVVRAGGGEFVRSIQRYNPDGSLTFHSAIEKGIVLALAEVDGLERYLRSALEEAREFVGEVQAVIACDCILRRLEIEQSGLQAEIDALVREHHIVGFSTYGEQFNSMHVNQTFTGVSIGHRE